MLTQRITLAYPLDTTRVNLDQRAEASECRVLLLVVFNLPQSLAPVQEGHFVRLRRIIKLGSPTIAEQNDPSEEQPHLVELEKRDRLSPQRFLISSSGSCCSTKSG
jgi:hypothetical protein